jgi:dTDP-glucose 4,6-dehydratase
MNILVTGGMGFIGSNFIEYIIDKPEVNSVINIDCPSKTWAAADKRNCERFLNHSKYKFYDVWLDMLKASTDKQRLLDVIDKHSVDTIVHFAAESHVDNSIKRPRICFESNVLGTFNLLEICREHYPTMRFHHISTDEVYGSLGDDGAFTEESRYDPSSPYSASKAASDHFVKAYFTTFKLNVTISNCSNNYGPYQHTEKFIPTVITSLLNNKKIPVYGTGTNIRDWIYVIDHCEGVWNVLTKGKLGESYNIGGNCERRNLEIIKEICRQMNKNPDNCIEFVEDRKGHDYRYAIDNTKYLNHFKEQPKTSFEEGITKTINFYKNKL